MGALQVAQGFCGDPRGLGAIGSLGGLGAVGILGILWGIPEVLKGCGEESGGSGGPWRGQRDIRGLGELGRSPGGLGRLWGMVLEGLGAVGGPRRY